MENDSFIQVLTDGWETGIIKVENKKEFYQILTNLESSKKLTKIKLGENGFRFSSEIARNKVNKLDSIYFKRPGFLISTIKNDQIFVIEKYW